MAENKEAKERLQSILEKIATEKEIANRDLTGWDPRTVGGMVIRQRDAQDEVAQLTQAYKTLITNSIVKVFVTGAKVDEAVDYLEKNGAVVVDANKCYKEIATTLEATLDAQRNFTLTQVMMVGQALRQYIEKYNLVTMAQPKLDVTDLDNEVATLDDVTARVKKAVENTNGPLLSVASMHDDILDRAIELKVDTTVMAVIIRNVSEDQRESYEQSLFGSQSSISIEATSDKTNEELIKELNSKIRKLFKKQ